MTNGQQPPGPPGAAPGAWGQQAPPAPQQPPAQQPPPQQFQQPPAQQPPPQQFQQPPAQQPPQQFQQPPAQQPPQQFQQPQQPPPQQWQQPAAQPPPQYQQPPAQQMPQQGGYAANPFQGLTSGDPSMQRLPYLEDGSYKIKVNAIRFKPSRAGKMLYIIEVEIIESNNPMRPPGMRCSCFINMSDVDTRGQHVASFISAIHGCDPTTVPKEATVAPWTDQQTGQQMSWQHYAEQSLHDTNPWQGAEIGVHVQTVPTRAGGEFSLHTWVPATMFVAIPMPAKPAPTAAPAAQAPAPQPGQPQQWAPPPAQWGGGQQGGPQG